VRAFCPLCERVIRTRRPRGGTDADPEVYDRHTDDGGHHCTNSRQKVAPEDWRDGFEETKDGTLERLSCEFCGGSYDYAGGYLHRKGCAATTDVPPPNADLPEQWQTNVLDQSFEPLDYETAATLTDDQLVTAVAMTVTLGRATRAAQLSIGTALVARRNVLSRGEWGRWLTQFARATGRSDRSLQRWMLAAQQTLGLQAPKGAHETRRAGSLGDPNSRVGRAIEDGRNPLTEEAEAKAKQASQHLDTPPDPNNGGPEREKAGGADSSPQQEDEGNSKGKAKAARQGPTFPTAEARKLADDTLEPLDLAPLDWLWLSRWCSERSRRD
jgi:hypothetical protein